MASLSSERDGMGFSMEGDNPCTDAGRMDVRCRNIIFIPSGSPVIGWSVIIYYYTGLCLSSMDGGRRNRLFAITALGFFLPHIAGGYHAAMLAAGWILRKLEVGWQRTLK